MPTEDDDLMLDDEDFEDDEEDSDADSSDSTESDQTGPTIEQVLARVEALESATAAHRKDLLATVGRYQSLQAKVDAGDGTAKTLRELRTSQKAADAAIDAILTDEAIDPTVKARASAARSQSAVELEKEELLARLEALEKVKVVPADQTSPDDDEDSAFIKEIHALIEANDLNVNDPSFDWQGEATKVYRTQGAKASRKYFLAKINELLEETNSTDRREMRKSAASKRVAPEGSAKNELDESRPLADRLKALRGRGAI